MWMSKFRGQFRRNPVKGADGKDCAVTNRVVKSA